MMADIELISKEEKEFIQQYYDTLKLYQEKSSKVVSTKISMSYAILNKLPLKSVVFHPLSIYYLQDQEKPHAPTYESIKNTIQEIIEFELYAEDCILSGAELTLLIKHFKGFAIETA